MEMGYSRLSKEDLWIFRALIYHVAHTLQRQDFQSFRQPDWTQYAELKYIYFIDILPSSLIPGTLDICDPIINILSQHG